MRGVLIARASGQPLEVFYGEHTFEPLGIGLSGPPTGFR